MKNHKLSSALLIGLGMFLGATCANTQSSSIQKPVAEITSAFAPQPAFAEVSDGAKPVVLADVAERVVPSVVNISVRKKGGDLESSPMMRDPMLRKFFGPMPNQRRHMTGLGSGVIVSPDGVVLTNNHVVDDADEVDVTLSDGREVKAKVVGTDPRSDLAVIKLDGVSGLAALKFGSSRALRLGEVVLAVGNPFGVGRTVTMGIVSALGRSNVGIVDYEDFIQTDAAINPGNSGGALVNMRGELIGINTAIVSRSGGYQGIGFAIPADMARPIMKSLLEDGTVHRGWLGVAIQDLSSDLGEALDLGDKQRGALVSQVVDDSPAARAGLKRGDVIVELDGEKLINAGQLRNRIAARGPGKTVKLGIIRDGKRETISVKLDKLAEDKVASVGAARSSASAAGLEVKSLTPELRRQLDLGDEVSGVVVTGVDPDSAADRANLRRGDVITEVNRKPIKKPAQLTAAIESADGPVLLLVRRGEATIYVALDVK